MIELTLLKSGWAAARLTSGYQRLVRSGTTATSVDIIVDICAELSQFYNLIQFSSDSTGSELKCVFYFYLRISALLYLQNRKQMRGSQHQQQSNQTSQSPARPSSVHYLLSLSTQPDSNIHCIMWMGLHLVCRSLRECMKYITIHLSFIYLMNMSMCI